MQQPELNQLLSYLDGIIAATNNGKMIWSRANQTTYVWNVIGRGNARLVIQKISPSPIFTMVAFNELNKAEFQANGGENSPINQKLGLIFVGIEQYQDKKGLDFLKTIIPP
jgi:hypothetical protein